MTDNFRRICKNCHDYNKNDSTCDIHFIIKNNERKNLVVNPNNFVCHVFMYKLKKQEVESE